ncbi:MAG: radical SAM protein [Alphaproteobacteria bacterium]|nr:radical SAM protein [Alphaproteobacteria bacterium]MCB9797266.1 radical SAM protein [Alphaproteobacteria bacterium]
MIRPAELAPLSEKALRPLVLEGLAQGRPLIGPQTVHVDVTNACNAACVTCWDHSPLLATPRPASWKRRRMAPETFTALVEQLAALGSVRRVILSGMGDPLVHPDIYDFIALVKAHGWQLTMLSNLVAADLPRLLARPPDQLLVGVQGASPDTYAAFHPGWTERHFFTLIKALRALTRAGVRTRHVQVINRDTAPELVEMVRFGQRYGADRVNFKLASLYDGTEGCAVAPEQLAWMQEEGVPAARAEAERLGVPTNLALFETQLAAGLRQEAATAPIAEIGCSMGYVYTRITVDGEVLYCCNTEVSVGRLEEATLGELWFGDKWQRLRGLLAEGRFLRGCDKCGKIEQNVKWAERRREAGVE